MAGCGWFEASLGFLSTALPSRTTRLRRHVHVFAKLSRLQVIFQVDSRIQPLGAFQFAGYYGESSMLEMLPLKPLKP